MHVQWWGLDVAMVPLLAWAIFMDALDGWVARRRREDSDSGALYDIAGDRIVELALWSFFAVRRDVNGVPLVPYWVPILIIARTVLTDYIRSVAFREGKTPFGAKTMMESGWAKQLVSSRWSRGLYGGMKAVAFCALGAEFALQRAPQYLTLPYFRLLVDLLVYGTVGFCLLRAVPVLWDGRRYLLGGTSDVGSRL
ncbi:MAG: hypothetical protein KatS3mg115_0593 [Candidatus Poribacteria bacterium]|nr:MAG: hypothetical protein KatS3mg115_0593 [Candidatus Poribacteria bacterium]